jgi:superfamily II DNA or RNA helicase
MSGENWRALELAVSRVLMHCGWHNVQDVGESGDKGADTLAVRFQPDLEQEESYLVQVKAISGVSYVGKGAVDQAVQGQAHYGAKIAVVATNGEFTKSAYSRRDELRNKGFDVRLWNGAFLSSLLSRWHEYSPSMRPLRGYQKEIVDSIVENHDRGNRKSFFIVATGLGKTVIAAAAADALMRKGLKKVLVLCHSIDLAQQLQAAFWSQLPKSIPTRLFMGGELPVPIDGINFGLYQSLFSNLGGIDPDAFDLIIVDEAHHALANAFASCISHLEPLQLIGMTATPWRGDGASIESIFGEPLKKVSLVDGMRMGFLAKVDYRIMCDNINWDEIPKIAKHKLSIRDLNKRLFIPQRDDAVIAQLVKVCGEIERPKIAVFSPSIAHAEEFAKRLNSCGIPAACASTRDKIARRRILMDFSSDKLAALTSVDVLNEGIDVPSVNVLVFLKATHSRRIFVQQLGRGLRIADGKKKVIVLDFVTDIRRMAAVMELDKEAREGKATEGIERVHLREGVVTFDNENAQHFVDVWLKDVSSLQDEEGAEKLAFPDEGAFG